jgi:hypothetical protein
VVYPYKASKVLPGRVTNPGLKSERHQADAQGFFIAIGLIAFFRNFQAQGQ